MKDKKVILINRPLIRVKGFHILSCKWQTLNLAYIAAILEKKKIICKIIDARALELTVKSVVQCVKKFQPDLVIFDTEPFDFYQCPNPNWETINKSIKGIKNVVEAKILSLGPQATLFDKKLMSKLPIDFILKGDNPFLVAEVALDILRYNNTKHIGVSYFDNGKFIFGKTII